MPIWYLFIDKTNGYILHCIIYCLLIYFYFKSFKANLSFFNIPFSAIGGFPGYANLSLNKEQLIILICLLLPTLLILLLKSPIKVLREQNLFTNLLFVFCGLIGVYPRFSFFHLQPLLPFLIILYLRIFLELNNKFSFLKILFIVPILAVFAFLTPNNFGKNTRFYSQADEQIAHFINQKVAINERVFLLGLSSTEYVLADRLPPRPWLDNFGWYYEMPTVQENTINRFKLDMPKMIMRRIPDKGNWYDLGTYQPESFLVFLRQNFIMMNVIQGNIEVWIRKN